MQKYTALISTNVLARGIDIPEVDIVINYDIPKFSNAQYWEADIANYLHRVGRTGRFQTDGLAITFYLNNDTNEGEIEKFMMKKIEKEWEVDMDDVDFDKFMSIFYEMRPKFNPN